MINSAYANVTTYVGTTAGNSFNQMNGPVDVAFHSATGRIWVADQNNLAVRFIQPDFNGLSINTPNGQNLPFVPNGITIVGQSVYITRNHRISELSISSGNLTSLVIGGNNAGTTDGIGSSAAFNNPRGIHVDEDGNLWIADFTSRKIRVVDVSNQQVASMPGAYFQVTDVEVAPDGNVFAVEKGNQRVRLVTDSPNATDEIVATGFVGPEGIAIHPTTGEIYISDTDAHCIYVLEKVEE